MPQSKGAGGIRIYGIWKPENIRIWPTLSMWYLVDKANDSSLGLARTVYIHRIWPYIWWSPSHKYRIYTLYVWFWPTLLITPYPRRIMQSCRSTDAYYKESWGQMCRVGQNRIYAPYIWWFPHQKHRIYTVYMHRIFGNFPTKKHRIYTAYR